jgi:hypothetical protein
VKFLLNDITPKKTIKSDNPNKNTLNANILAKVLHEFKTPLITIIYLLKK